MKKSMLIISLFLSFQAFADCRPIIDSKLNEVEARNGQTNQNLIVGGVLGGILTVIIPPVGISIIGLSAAGSGLHEMSKGQLRKLRDAIDEAYAYNETGEEGKSLQKLLKKVKRKVDNKITMQDLVDVVISSNQNENLCQAKSLNQFAKRIEINL